ncbi:MAG: hypothetical protein FD169_1186 [Bacillota bacterium]|nr:MAG: hypothetical protein FD169_1186 [Bacillota bacterium]
MERSFCCHSSEDNVAVIPQDYGHWGVFLCHSFNSVPSVGSNHTARAEGTACHAPTPWLVALPVKSGRVGKSVCRPLQSVALCRPYQR